MTKRGLAEQILQASENVPAVKNSKQYREGQVEAVMSLLDTLEPKNIGQFANWGHPDQKSTPKECWK